MWYILKRGWTIKTLLLIADLIQRQSIMSDIIENQSKIHPKQSYFWMNCWNSESEQHEYRLQDDMLQFILWKINMVIQIIYRNLWIFLFLFPLYKYTAPWFWQYGNHYRMGIGFILQYLILHGKWNHPQKFEWRVSYSLSKIMNNTFFFCSCGN